MALADDQLWLRISLFCSKEDWHELLDTGIKPFLKHLSQTYMIDAYKLSLNDARGENIRLAILVTIAQSKLIAREADAYFTHYFQQTHLQGMPAEEATRAIFMPFPNNSVQYGLYSVSREDAVLPLHHTILPLILINGLASDAIDDEAIITFAFSLHVSTIKVVMEYDKTIWASIYATYAETIARDRNSFNREQLMVEVSENREYILQIVNNIFAASGDDTPNRDLYWLPKWENALKEHLSGLPKAGQHTIPQSFYTKLASTINESLGLSKGKELLLACFIESAFSFINATTPPFHP